SVLLRRRIVDGTSRLLALLDLLLLGKPLGHLHKTSLTGSNLVEEFRPSLDDDGFLVFLTFVVLLDDFLRDVELRHVQKLSTVAGDLVIQIPLLAEGTELLFTGSLPCRQQAPPLVNRIHLRPAEVLVEGPAESLFLILDLNELRLDLGGHTILGVQVRRHNGTPGASNHTPLGRIVLGMSHHNRLILPIQPNGLRQLNQRLARLCPVVSPLGLGVPCIRFLRQLLKIGLVFVHLDEGNAITRRHLLAFLILDSARPPQQDIENAGKRATLNLRDAAVAQRVKNRQARPLICIVIADNMQIQLEEPLHTLRSLSRLVHVVLSLSHTSPYEQV